MGRHRRRPGADLEERERRAASVTFTRLDTVTQPGRVVSSVYADPTNANHALVTFSGYDSTTPVTPGHVFDVVFDPATSSATWTNISYDIGDQPVNDAVLDVATGDVYVVDRLRRLSPRQRHADLDSGGGRPSCGHRLGPDARRATQAGDRLLYAATHGRGAYRLRLK